MNKKMKIGLTGHTSGLGKMIQSVLRDAGHEVIGFSRSTGFHLPEDIPRVIDSCENLDVFINNTHHKWSQIDILDGVSKLWSADPSKTIINIGSLNDDFLSPSSLLRKESKKTLNSFHQSLLEHGPKCNLVLLQLGFMDTPLLNGITLPLNEGLMPTEKVANLILEILNTDQLKKSIQAVEFKEPKQTHNISQSKIAIVGASRGIGHAVLNELTGQQVNAIALNRSDGFDIDCPDGISRIIDYSKDCDIIINNAYQKWQQTELLIAASNAWSSQKKPRLIVNISSLLTQRKVRSIHPYSIHKLALEEASNQINRSGGNLKSQIIRFGSTDTDLESSKTGPKSNPQEVANLIYFFLNKLDSFEIPLIQFDFLRSNYLYNNENYTNSKK